MRFWRGDGNGPEVTDQGVRALEAVGGAFGHSFELSNGEIVALRVATKRP